MLFASNISKVYSEKTLFSGLNLAVATGDRIALIGPNGSGKTTLLDILAGDTSPDSGSTSRQRNISLGYLKQEPALFTDKPLLQEVLDTSPDVVALMDGVAATQQALSREPDPAKQAELMQRLDRLEMSLEAAGGGDRDHEAKAILSGLGFKEGDFLRPMGEFSGGWVMRAGLARLLFKNPDLLLLDEPTNHLDLDANLWFEKYLASFRGGVIITSHDRAFLNQVATKVLAIEQDEGDPDEGQLRRVPPCPGALPEDQAGGCGQAGTRDEEADAIHRAFSGQGDEGQPGAEPVETAQQGEDCRNAKDD